MGGKNEHLIEAAQAQCVAVGEYLRCSGCANSHAAKCARGKRTLNQNTNDAIVVLKEKGTFYVGGAVEFRDPDQSDPLPDWPEIASGHTPCIRY